MRLKSFPQALTPRPFFVSQSLNTTPRRSNLSQCLGTVLTPTSPTPKDSQATSLPLPKSEHRLTQTLQALYLDLVNILAPPHTASHPPIPAPGRLLPVSICHWSLGVGQELVGRQRGLPQVGDGEGEEQVLQAVKGTDELRQSRGSPSLLTQSPSLCTRGVGVTGELKLRPSPPLQANWCSKRSSSVSRRGPM